MNYDASLINYFLHAGFVVKAVMLILFSASIFSWTYILDRHFYLRRATQATAKFEEAFWSGEALSTLYSANRHAEQRAGIATVFCAGYQEYARFRQQQPSVALPQMIKNINRAMRAAQMREQDKLENRLPFLAIVGSTSPYVGLFGTVWGIMQAFRALANVQQATVSMVAPGIAEALIATALGLFAAIPAVIAYNRYITEIGRLTNRFEAFQEEFINILVRQIPEHHPEQQAQPAEVVE